MSSSLGLLLCAFLGVAVVKAGWRSEAQDRIDEIRRVKISITAIGDGSADVQVLMKKNGFFGSCVNASKMIDPQWKAYQDVFYKHFTWGVLENALKWAWMEETRGDIDYDLPLSAIAKMKEHGIRIRCHCVFWAKEEFNSEWVKQLRGDDMVAAMNERVEGVINATKGLCEEWDVNNENLHETFYQDMTGDDRITQKMFDKIHELDPEPTLFVNDYYVLSEEPTAIRIRDQGLQYLNESVPVGGIGIQGHMRDLNVSYIKERIEIVAEAGLPIVITELGVNNDDVEARAVDLADTITMLYSLPQVNAVLFWGFWNESIWETDAPFYEGDDVLPNAAGVAFETLLYETWGTNVTQTLQGGETFSVMGHRGTYEIHIVQDGLETVETFVIDDHTDITVDLTGEVAAVALG